MKYLILLFSMFLLVSCNSDSHFKEIDTDFDQNRWTNSEARNFEFSITDSTKRYDVLMHFSHVAEFQFDLIPIKFEMTKTGNPASTERFLLRIKDTDGKDRGDCMGDYCDLEQEIFSDRQLPTGKYTISLANEFQNKYLPNVLGVGIEVRTAASEK